MSTITSARREAGKAVDKSYDGIFLSVAGLFAGVALMILGAQININASMIVGFVLSAISFLYLNTRFWGWVHERHGKHIAINEGNYVSRRQ